MAASLLRCTARWHCSIDDDRQLITAFLINKFRGDVGVLQPGLDELSERTGVPFAGVLPWLPNVWLDAEDTLEVASLAASGCSRGRAPSSGRAAATDVKRHRC